VARERLKVILATLTGDLPVKEACRRLQISESRFHQLRQQALVGMQEGLSPRPPGRPARETEDPEVLELRRQVAWLEEELEISRLRTEIALWKPSLLRDPVSPPPKKGGSSPKRERGRRSDGGRSAT
jgi:transposase-like protein